MAGKKTQALARWDEELAKQAAAYVDQEANTGGGTFMSIRGGTLSLNGAPIPNNELAAVIVDSVLVNAKYDGAYDPDNPQAPVCYAFGRDEKTMKPHAESPTPQAEGCDSCAHNQFGTADKGRGKACKNGRRLAIIPAGTLDPRTGEFTAFEDGDELTKQQVVYLNLPPTSIQSFGAYVKSLGGTLKRPPYAVFTKVALVNDAKTQVKVTFELLGPAPDEVIGALIDKNKEQRAVIEFPFPKVEEAAPQPARGRGKLQSRGAGRRF